jgi:hypothetical protein
VVLVAAAAKRGAKRERKNRIRIFAKLYFGISILGFGIIFECLRVVLGVVYGKKKHFAQG